MEKGQNERDAAGDSWVPGAVPDAGKRKPLPPNGKNASAVSNQSENFETETSTASVPEPEIDMSEVEAVAGIQFYSARRAFKYQTGPDTQYHSFKEAVDDLAAKFGKDPYWVGQNLGDTNDLGQIYINLSRTKEETETEKDATYNKAGILFYDPRRTYKYWVADDSKHHTLEAAINALAEKYSQTPDWIIDHLEETNDLTEIHRNLGKGISAKSDK